MKAIYWLVYKGIFRCRLNKLSTMETAEKGPKFILHTIIFFMRSRWGDVPSAVEKYQPIENGREERIEVNKPNADTVGINESVKETNH